VASAATLDSVSLSHYEPLQWPLVKTFGGMTAQAPGTPGPVTFTFDAYGRSFELQLTANNSLLDAARNTAAGDAVPYRGHLAGNPDSWVRIVMAGGQPAGLIWDGTELFAIERGGRNLAGTGAPIIYRLADAIIAPGAMSCDSGDVFGNAGDAYKSLLGELNAIKEQAAGAVSEIDIGTVGDAEFFIRHGNNSQQAILDRMNNVDGIFSGQVGVQINVPIVQVFSDSGAGNYPFTTTVTAGTLLDELAAYRNGEPNQYVNGLTHLWTGKDVESDTGNSTTVGIAFTGALCRRQFGAGLSEGNGSSTFDSLIAAHEIGHNFGAPHDGTAGSACEAETGNFLMAPSLNGSDQFSQCSLDQMADDIAAASCITPLPSIDMRVGLSGQDPTILLGNTATLTFDVANAGTLDASNVATQITLPGNVSLISAAASLGTCTAGAGLVDCTIGGVAGLSTVTVTLTSNTTAVGVGTFNASVTADVDDNTGNNQGSATLTVQPAVNLTVMPPSPRQLNVNDSATLTASLQNTSVLDATGVTLSISLSSGLRADSASWALGACAVTSNQIDCQAASFAAQSNTTLSIGLTALADGNNTLDLSLSSLEADANPANNTASTTITVGTPQNNDSGGGATSLWLLALLGGLVGVRRADQARMKLVP